MDNKKTGKLIQTIRTERGITQKELAEKLQVSNTTITKWETGLGFPEIALLEPLADALHISVTELMDGEKNAEDIDIRKESLIKDLIHLSNKEKQKNTSKHRFALIVGVVILTIFGLLLIYFLGKKQEKIILVNETSGILLPIALILGLIAWILPTIKISCGRKMKSSIKSVFSTISFVCCSIALWIPTFYMDMLARKEDTSAMLDTAWGFNLAAMLLLFVTVILNIVAYIVCLKKVIKTENKVGNTNEKEDNE